MPRIRAASTTETVAGSSATVVTCSALLSGWCLVPPRLPECAMLPLMSSKCSPVLTPGQVFARRVRERRTQLHLTQKQLSERVAALGRTIDRATIVKIEKGAQRVQTRAELIPL